MQVQESLKDILNQTISKTDLKTDLITYADKAHIMEFDKNDYVQVIESISAGGLTNFKSAFTKLYTLMAQTGKKKISVYLR